MLYGGTPLKQTAPVLKKIVRYSELHYSKDPVITSHLVNSKNIHYSRVIKYIIITKNSIVHVEDSISIHLAPVVQTSDSAIHRINHYPADSVIDFRNTYPLDSDLSGG